MKNQDFEIIKTSGKRVKFSSAKLHRSLLKSGATEEEVKQIVDQVMSELYQGISTREIYNRSFSLLKRKKPIYGSKFKLKKAIYELGPTGFPFEKFVAAILGYSGYTTEVGKTIQGTCVTHEVDVYAKKNGRISLVECKFHGEEGRKCNVKVPLYIQSRYMDILSHWNLKKSKHIPLDKVWVATNTRFTEDAMRYGKCAGMYLLSWDLPAKDGLKDRIDRLGLYPITVSTLLSNREKQFLLSRDVVLCRQLLNDHFFLDHLEVSKTRKNRIMKELWALCKC